MTYFPLEMKGKLNVKCGFPKSSDRETYLPCYGLVDPWLTLETDKSRLVVYRRVIQATHGGGFTSPVPESSRTRSRQTSSNPATSRRYCPSPARRRKSSPSSIRRLWRPRRFRGAAA